MSPATSDDLLARLAGNFPRLIELSLRPAYFDLLRALGNPHEHLPPVIHVAGTNGKGSTCAFLRAILEAAGKRVHVYTSPHLVRFYERIRTAGELIAEPDLVALLQEVRQNIAPDTISQFEATTAAAFAAFARTPADFLVLETGLGGRYDATNVVARPLASAISRISFDHRDYLGDTLEKIAGEKAGIIKPGIPCFIGRQFDALADNVFTLEAAAKQSPLLHYGRDWQIEILPDGMLYGDKHGKLRLPPPALLGAHQFENASLAISVLRHTVPELSEAHYADGLRHVQWPARLQRLASGPLAALLPSGWELWLDGGHNDSAGEVLATQARQWRTADGAAPKPLHLVYGMLKTKMPEEFLQPLAPCVASLQAVVIPEMASGLSAIEARDAALKSGIADSAAADSVLQALRTLAKKNTPPARILICGSLYLAGHVLTENAP